MRAVEAPDGTVAALQIDVTGAAGGANWFIDRLAQRHSRRQRHQSHSDFKFAAVTITAPVTEGSHDFNGDGRGDLLWRNINGQVVDWEFNGGALIGHNFGTVGNVWRIVDTGNFNGHGESDILSAQ